MKRIVFLLCAIALVACDSKAEPPPVTNIPDPSTVGAPVAVPDGKPGTPAAAADPKAKPPTADAKAKPPTADAKTPGTPASAPASAPKPSTDVAGKDDGEPIPEDWNKKLGYKDLADMYPKGGRKDMAQLKADVTKARGEMPAGSDAKALTGDLEAMLELLAVTVPALVDGKKFDEANKALRKAFELGHTVTRKNLAKLHEVLQRVPKGGQPSQADTAELGTYSNNARGASSLMGFAAQGIFVTMHAGELAERKDAFNYMLGQYKLLLKAGGGKLVQPKPGENPYFYVASNHAGNIGALLWVAHRLEEDAGQKAAMKAELEKLSVRKTLPPQPKAPSRPARPSGPGGMGAPPGAPGSAPAGR